LLKGCRRYQIVPAAIVRRPATTAITRRPVLVLSPCSGLWTFSPSSTWPKTIPADGVEFAASATTGVASTVVWCGGSTSDASSLMVGNVADAALRVRGSNHFGILTSPASGIEFANNCGVLRVKSIDLGCSIAAC